jgi:hypothetical protein
VACDCPGWLPLYAAVHCALALAAAVSASATIFAREKGNADEEAGGHFDNRLPLTTPLLHYCHVCRNNECRQLDTLPPFSTRTRRYINFRFLFSFPSCTIVRPLATKKLTQSSRKLFISFVASSLQYPLRGPDRLLLFPSRMCSCQNVCLAPIICIFVDTEFVVPFGPFLALPRSFSWLTSLGPFTAFLWPLFGPFPALSWPYSILHLRRL